MNHADIVPSLNILGLRTHQDEGQYNHKIWGMYTTNTFVSAWPSHIILTAKICFTTNQITRKIYYSPDLIRQAMQSLPIRYYEGRLSSCPGHYSSMAEEKYDTISPHHLGLATTNVDDCQGKSSKRQIYHLAWSAKPSALSK